MDHKQLQAWLDGIACMIVWMNAHGEDAKLCFAELAYHDIPGITDAIDGTSFSRAFSPRSSGYWKYMTELTREECSERYKLERD